MITNDPHRQREPLQPFLVGDLDPNKPLIHVLDDTSLDVVMGGLDTISDFLSYLDSKEQLLRSQRAVWAAGEEELLAWYLQNLDDSGQHYFPTEDADAIAIEEGLWKRFSASEEFLSRIAHDHVSYVWDRLIDRFAEHALGGTQLFASDPALQSSEVVMRIMASESRLERRMLSQALLEVLEELPSDQRRLRLCFSQSYDRTLYVFLAFPWQSDRSYIENRELRGKYLHASVLIAKHKVPKALDIVGIATESGRENRGRSEEAIYFDGRSWTPEDDASAAKMSEELEILMNPEMETRSDVEYPAAMEAAVLKRLPKNPRNKPCPCGSQRKYKRCHGA